MLSFIIHMQLYSTLSFIQNIFSISDWPNLDSLEPAPQWGKRAKNRVNKEKAVAWRGKRRGGGDVAEPRDVSWCCHSVIPFWWQMSSCWQIRCTVDSITLFQYHAHTIREKILKDERGWIGGINAFLQALPFLFPRLPLTRFASLYRRPHYSACNQQFFWYHGTSL